MYTEFLIEKVNKMIDQSIGELIDLKDRMGKEIRQKCQFIGMDREQRIVAKRIEDIRVFGMLGKEVRRMENILISNQANVKVFISQF